MWLPAKAFELFRISKGHVDALRTDNSTLRTVNDILQRQLAAQTANIAWMTVRLNGLEVERAALLEKLYGVRISVPEVAFQPATQPPPRLDDIFSDLGDEKARELGYPSLN